mmetsp:Transcript_103440/g.166753  ORF Transcript_103440/g.166753 Transcript_103440/m.166753 type:complete len:240 (+) Transcript_103440:426-1145(+)
MANPAPRVGTASRDKMVLRVRMVCLAHRALEGAMVFPVLLVSRERLVQRARQGVRATLGLLVAWARQGRRVLRARGDRLAGRGGMAGRGLRVLLVCPPTCMLCTTTPTKTPTPQGQRTRQRACRRRNRLAVRVRSARSASSSRFTPCTRKNSAGRGRAPRTPTSALSHSAGKRRAMYRWRRLISTTTRATKCMWQGRAETRFARRCVGRMALRSHGRGGRRWCRVLLRQVLLGRPTFLR